MRKLDDILESIEAAEALLSDMVYHNQLMAQKQLEFTKVASEAAEEMSKFG